MTSNEYLARRMEEPSNRQVIAVVDPVTFAKLDYDDKLRARLTGPGVMVLPENYDLTTSPMLLGLGRRGMWRKDSVLTQNPYHTELYEDDEEPFQHFVQSKVRLIAELVQHLGAKTFTYTETNSQATSDDVSSGAKGGKGPVKIEGLFSKAAEERLRRGLKIDYTWEGGAPDLAAARALLNHHNLTGDDSLTSLVNLRESKRNSHKSVVEQVDLLRESSSTIELAGKVRAGVTEAQSTGKRKRSTKAEVTVTVKVTY